MGRQKEGRKKPIGKSFWITPEERKRGAQARERTGLTDAEIYSAGVALCLESQQGEDSIKEEKKPERFSLSDLDAPENV